jgi:hypothetical protein
VLGRKHLMSRTLQTCFTSLSAIVLLGTVSLQPANARILCQGEFQVTQYGLIATPYCADEVIARVANSYGWHREAATVRTNPLSKVYICQTLGWDWRLQSPCAGYLPHGGGGH